VSSSGLQYEVRRTAAEPSGALVLLHGRGTDEQDLLPLLDALDPDGRFVGITLRAPLQLSPSGFHWYIVRELGRPDPPTFLDTYRLLSLWIDEELREVTGFGPERTVLGGFSQGAVVSYALGLGRGRPSPAALVALSGFIPEAPGFELDLEGHRDVAVAIGHGAQDYVIPVGFGQEAARRLDGAGLEVRYRESAMFHGIDPDFITELSRWLPGVVERREEPDLRRTA
jgi:phospholipase/carboxylesterase